MDVSAAAIVSVLLLPPVNLAGLGMIFWLFRRHRAARMLCGACIVLLLLLAMPVVATPLLASLETGLLASGRAADAPPQAIVVLGADVAVGTDASGVVNVLPGALTLQRLQWAASLGRRTHLPLLVTGGIVEPDAPPVAAIMAVSLHDDFGLPTRWIEGRSADTWENAHDSAAILRRDHIDSVWVVTHAWHMRRALIAFRDAGIAARPAIAQLDRRGTFHASAFVPRATDWLRSYYACHEWLGCLWYWLRARLHGGVGR